MNLIIDIGNTSTKAGIFNKNKLKKHFAVDGLIPKRDLEKITGDYKIDAAIISSVRNDSARLEKYIASQFNTINLSTHQAVKLPFNNLYKTPATLGRDRIANVAAAVSLYPQKNVLIIDAGTCLKFDFVDGQTNYYGGSIAPGLMMRFKALHDYTGKLPLIEPARTRTVKGKLKQSIKFIGQSTEECIRAGVQQGMINEIAATIAQYEKLYDALNIILTGGDWRLFAEHLKKSIFADPFLTLRGLHCILENNI